MKITLPEALAQLKDYAADEVADLLRLADKTGDRQEAMSCPIANYLYDVLGVECYVDTESAWINAGDYTPVGLPGGVTAFIGDFDSGIYPDLITPEEY